MTDAHEDTLSSPSGKAIPEPITEASADPVANGTSAAGAQAPNTIKTAKAAFKAVLPDILLLTSTIGFGILLVSYVLYHDWTAALSLGIFGVFFGLVLGLSELGPICMLRSSSSTRLKAFAATSMGLVVLLVIYAVGHLADDIANRHREEAAMTIIRSTLSADAETSRDAPVMEKLVPGYVMAAYLQDYPEPEATRFFMLRDTSRFEDATNSSLGLICAKLDQWRAPVTVTFDPKTETADFTQSKAPMGYEKDFDLYCRKVAG